MKICVLKNLKNSKLVLGSCFCNGWASPVGLLALAKMFFVAFETKKIFVVVIAKNYRCFDGCLCAVSSHEQFESDWFRQLKLQHDWASVSQLAVVMVIMR